jgi:hypothetical protein
VEASNGSGKTLFQDVGIWIHPRANGTGTVVLPPPPAPGQPMQASGEPWSDSFGKVPEKRSDERAISIALADPAIRSILLQHPTWLDSSPSAKWRSCSGKLLGRVVSFRFVTPTTFTATLPVIGLPEGKFAYSESVQKVLATQVLQLNVSVDLNVGHVVGADARAYDVPFEPGGLMTRLLTVTPPHDAGGPDTGNCPPPQTTG